MGSHPLSVGGVCLLVYISSIFVPKYGILYFVHIYMDGSAHSLSVVNGIADISSYQYFEDARNRLL